MHIFLFFLSLIACDGSLPFPISDLSGEWGSLLTHSNGPFSDEDFQFGPRFKMYVMKVNGSFRIQTTALRHIGKLYHANFTDNSIELYDEELATIANFDVSRLSNEEILVRGETADRQFSIFGSVSCKHQSVLSMVSKTSDDVYVLRLSPPRTVTAGEVIQRMLPGLSILIVMGFGRVYRARFWSQYAQMNTRTLRKRINEASNEQSKK